MGTRAPSTLAIATGRAAIRTRPTAPRAPRARTSATKVTRARRASAPGPIRSRARRRISVTGLGRAIRRQGSAPTPPWRMGRLATTATPARRRTRARLEFARAQTPLCARRKTNATRPEHATRRMEPARIPRSPTEPRAMTGMRARKAIPARAGRASVAIRSPAWRQTSVTWQAPAIRAREFARLRRRRTARPATTGMPAT